MVLTNNNRSKAYIQNFIKENIYPSNVVFLEESNTKIAGQTENDSKIFDSSDQELWRKCSVTGLLFNEKETVLSTLKKNGIPFKKYANLDPNSKLVIKALKRLPEAICIYSGPGGYILKKEIFKTGKVFIHAHSGKLPSYRGSTTIYYSLLLNENLSVSVIELNENIDEGNIILIDNYKLNSGSDIDYVIDNCIRAKSLIRFLKLKKYKSVKQKKEGKTFYIIHPVLKHISIIKNKAY